MNNWYQVLHVPQQASQQEIKQAYRKLAKQYHPDRNQGSAQAEQMFKQIQQAYETLSDEQRRSQYDQTLTGTTSEPRSASAHNHGAKRSTATASPDFDPRNVQAQFERFFGFNANGQKKAEPDNKTSKNPLDTSHIFDRYFGPRK